MITAKHSTTLTRATTMSKWMSNNDDDRYYCLITRTKYINMYCKGVESLEFITLQTNILDIGDDSDFLLY
jgi:hypothetical protein